MESNIKAQAAMLITLIAEGDKERVAVSVLRGTDDDINATAEDMAGVLASVANNQRPPFDDDPRLAALTEENAKLKEENRKLVDRICELNSELTQAESLAETLNDLIKQESTDAQ